MTQDSNPSNNRASNRTVPETTNKVEDLVETKKARSTRGKKPKEGNLSGLQDVFQIRNDFLRLYPICTKAEISIFLYESFNTLTETEASKYSKNVDYCNLDDIKTSLEILVELLEEKQKWIVYWLTTQIVSKEGISKVDLGVNFGGFGGNVSLDWSDRTSATFAEVKDQISEILINLSRLKGPLPKVVEDDLKEP